MPKRKVKVSSKNIHKKKPSKSNNTLRWIIPSLIIILLASFLAVGNSIKSNTVKTSTISKAANTLPNQKYEKRLFNPSEKFKVTDDQQNKIYYEGINPKEILTIEDNELMALKCQSFTEVNYKSKDWWVQLKDNQVKNIAQKISLLAPQGQKFALAFYCETENGTKFVTYSQMTDPYDYQTLKYTVALLERDKISEVATVYDPNSYYPSCEGPLELTTNGDLYVECGGGDTSYHYEIYKVNINTKTQDTMLTCERCSVGVGCNIAMIHKEESPSTVVNYCK
jgi:hypothetical protein